MERGWLALAVAVVVGCGPAPAAVPSQRPVAAAPTPVVIAPRAPVLVQLVAARTDGIVLDPAMRLTLALGDDAWSFRDTPRLGATHDGVVDAADQRFVYTIDVDTGQPLVAHAIPAWVGERGLYVVAGAFHGERAAALLHDGTALYWATPDAAPITLTPPAPRVVTPPKVRPARTRAERDEAEAERRRTGVISRRPYARPKSATTAPSGVEDWVFQLAQARLGFSPDGRRLIARDQAYDLASGRALLADATDELVLDIDERGAIVVRLAVDQVVDVRVPVHATPHDRVRVVALEWRPFGRGKPIRYPKPLTRLPHGASAAGGWIEVDGFEGNMYLDVKTGAVVASPQVAPVPTYPLIANRIDAVDVADDGRVAFLAPNVGVIARDTTAAELHVDPGATVRQIVLTPRGGFALVDTNVAGERRPPWIHAFDVNGGLGRGVNTRGNAGPLSATGVVAAGNGDHAFTLRGLDRADERVAYEVTGAYQHAFTQAQAVGDGARIVIREETGFAVVDAGKPVRRIAAPRADRWVVARDGSTLAASTGGTLTVWSVDDGSIRHTATSTWIGALAAERSVTAAGDADGVIRIWRDGVMSMIDLRSRHDRATALAISPDQRTLAIGTARGLVLTVAL